MLEFFFPMSFFLENLYKNFPTVIFGGEATTQKLIYARIFRDVIFGGGALPN